MKGIREYLAVTVCLVAILTGCAATKALFGGKAAPTSAPVELGIASTNDSTAVAYLKGAAAVNNAVPSPYQPLVSAGIDTLVALAGYIAGRIHAAANSGIAKASAPPPAPKV